MHVEVHTWDGSTYGGPPSVVIDQDERRAAAGHANASGGRCGMCLWNMEKFIGDKFRKTR